MRPRQYRIYVSTSEFVTMINKEDVIKYLDQFKQRNTILLNNIEVFDPKTGWNTASNWLKLKDQNIN